LTGEESSELQHCGLEVAPDHMLVYGKDVVHQRSDRKVEYATMSVPMDEFPVLCRTIIGREFLEGSYISVLRPDPSLMSRLVKLHNAVGQLAHNAPEVLLTPEVLRALENELMHTLVRCLAHGAGVEPNTRHQRYGSIMRRFEAFLDTNCGRPIYLAEICG